MIDESGDIPSKPSIETGSSTQRISNEAEDHKARLEKIKAGASTIALSVPFEPIDALREAIQNELNKGEEERQITLNGTGEAHYSAIPFRKKGPLPVKDLAEEDLEVLDTLKGHRVEIIGIGTIPPGSPEEIKQALASGNPESRLVVFLVIKVPPAFKVWHDEFFNRYNLAHPDAPSFKPEADHITIGKTGFDIFGRNREINHHFDSLVDDFKANLVPGGLTFTDVVGQVKVPQDDGSFKLQYQPV